MEQHPNNKETHGGGFFKNLPSWVKGLILALCIMFIVNLMTFANNYGSLVIQEKQSKIVQQVPAPIIQQPQVNQQQKEETCSPTGGKQRYGDCAKLLAGRSDPTDPTKVTCVDFVVDKILNLEGDYQVRNEERDTPFCYSTDIKYCDYRKVDYSWKDKFGNARVVICSTLNSDVRVFFR